LMNRPTSMQQRKYTEDEMEEITRGLQNNRNN
jgi:hypothetical protein